MVVGQSNVNVVNGLMAVPGVRAAHKRAECGAEIKKKCEIFFGQLLLKSRFADSTMCNKIDIKLQKLISIFLFFFRHLSRNLRLIKF